MNSDPASLEELSLLECLHAIAHGEELAQRSYELRDRLIAIGLATQTEEGLSLTPAGIERCRSLQHRVASDREVQKALGRQQASDEGPPSMIVVANSVSAELNEIRKSDEAARNTPALD